MSKLKVIFLNTFTTVIFTLIFSVVFLLFGIFTANKAGAENMGVYSLTMSLYNILTTIASSGLTLASSRITAEEIAKGKHNNAIKNLYNCICFGIFCSFFAIFFIYVFSQPASLIILHNKVNQNTVKALGLSLPFISVSSVIIGYFTAVRKAYKMSIIQLIENLIEILICICFLNTYQIKDANTLCLILIIANAVSKITACLLHLILFKIEISNVNTIKKATVSLRQMLKIVLPVSISSHIKSSLSGLKHTLVPICLEKYSNNCTAALSEYGRINAMVMPVVTFPCCLFISVANLLVPEIAALNIKNKKIRINQIISKIYKITMIISIFTVTSLILYGKNISKLFYKDPSIGVYISLLASVIPFIYIDCITDAILKGIDLQLQVVLINIIDTIISIVLIYFILPVSGISGYILVIYISEIFNAVASNYILIRKLKYKTDTTNSLIKPVVSALISVLTVTLFSLKGLCSFIFFSIIYTTLLFAFKVVKHNEIQIILKM